jgi:alpha 1,2-mannosyltransferase
VFFVGIQVWYNGDSELPSSSLGFFDKYGVETYNLADYVAEDAFQTLSSNVGDRPFQYKPLAIKYTDLEEVLLLDADNTPTADPTFLFDDSRYQEIGSIFWPDYWTTHSENPIWSIAGAENVVEREQESGQMLINKHTAWTAIAVVTEMQTPLFYSLLNGDKDTFRFAWKMTNTPYLMNPHAPASIGFKREDVADGKEAGFCGHTMGQHDLDGNLLFIHHNNLKLSHGWKRGAAYFNWMEEAPASADNFRVRRIF